MRGHNACPAQCFDSQFHHFIRDAACPNCGEAIDLKLPQLGRSYLSLVGIPLLPLNHVAVCGCHFHFFGNRCTGTGEFN